MTNAVENTSPKALRTLVLVLAYPHTASYYDDWRDAFLHSPHFSCAVENVLSVSLRQLEAKLKNFDAVIVLHSCNSDTLDFVEPLAPALAARNNCKLIVFNGNEYNSPYVSMERRIAFLRNAQADFAATQLLLEAGEYLYANAGCKIVSIPHALNPQAFSQPGSDHRRPIDIGVKGYRYPPYLGDDDRNKFIAELTVRAKSAGLTLDVSEDKRLARSDWAQYLSSCRGTVSTEAGSWYLCPNDQLVHGIRKYMRSKDKGLTLKNESALRRAVRKLPTPVKAALWTLLKKGPVKFEMLEDYNTPFEEIEEKFFRGRLRPPVYGKAISSRHFDAIGMKTCQILLEGRYSDILQPHEHYIPVKSDLSNISDALAQFQDQDHVYKITNTAHDFVMASHTYTHRADTVYRLLTETAKLTL